VAEAPVENKTVANKKDIVFRGKTLVASQHPGSALPTVQPAIEIAKTSCFD
jgi:hypothetical protein